MSVSQPTASSSDFTRATIVTRICTVEGCTRPPTARGWCGMHYMRWHRHGDPLGAPPKVIPTPEAISAEMREALARAEEVAR